MTATDSAATDPPGDLTLPYCEPCGQWRIARAFCPRHPGDRLTRKRLSGAGTVFSYTVSHVAMAPQVAGALPYRTVLVATAEGPRVLAHTEPGAEPAIGDAVRIVEADASLRDRLPGTGGRLALPVAQTEVSA